MQAGQDINIDIAGMQRIQKQIDEELKEVKVVLKKVNKCCEKDPAEDDTILMAIDEVGQNLNESWNNLTNMFDFVSNQIIHGIQKAASAVEQKKQEVQNMKTGL